MIEFKDNLVVCNGQTIELMYPIEDVIELEDRFVVLYKLGQFFQDGCQNVYCYSKEGTPLWRIMPPRIQMGGVKNLGQFVAILLVENELHAVDFYARNFVIDIKTGDPVSMIFAK